jgi:hypothetical protein
MTPESDSYDAIVKSIAHFRVREIVDFNLSRVTPPAATNARASPLFHYQKWLIVKRYSRDPTN